MTEVPILVSMVNILLKKGTRVDYINHHLKPKPRVINRIDIVNDCVAIRYHMAARQTQEWRGLSCMIDIDKIEQQARLIQDPETKTWELHCGSLTVTETEST
jgi:hypothetical protein